MILIETDNILYANLEQQYLILIESNNTFDAN